MSQIDELKSNINKLTDKIIALKEKQHGPALDISKYYMTDRQIAKKMLTVGTGFAPAQGGGSPVPIADEKTVHTIVYGKLEYGSDGKLLDDEVKYPNCVDHNVAMPDTHPSLDKIKTMKKEAKNAVILFQSKVLDLIQEFTQCAIEIGATAAALADAILPPSPKPAVAFSLLMSIISSIMNLISKITELIPLLGPLLFIELLVPLAILETVLGSINAIFEIIIGGLDLVDGLLVGITTIKSILP